MSLCTRTAATLSLAASFDGPVGLTPVAPATASWGCPHVHRETTGVDARRTSSPPGRGSAGVVEQGGRRDHTLVSTSLHEPLRTTVLG